MNPTEFARRRRQLMRMMDDQGIAILPSAPVRTRSRDTDYPYRQDSDFHYLTGFHEPDSVVVLVPGRPDGEYIMFCRERDKTKELWDGFRTGPEGAVRDYAADDAFPIDDIDEILPGLMESCSRVYYAMGLNPDFDTHVAEWVNALRSGSSPSIHAPQEFVALDHLLHDMRLYKSRAEITAMRRSAKVAVAAHKRAMRATQPGKFEYEIEAEFLHEFRRNGARVSYNPIVGGGNNACTLHYVNNDQQLQDGDLLLIDAGCELDYYASDITRTFPVNGKFSAEQRAIYDIVLEAQLAAIDLVQKNRHWNEPHDAAVRVVTKGLKKLGLLEGSLPKLIKDGAYREFFMHKTGHWLGIDVHDVGDYMVGDEWRLLEPGMVMTVEPGIYLPNSRRLPAKWRGIGIRIEDDVVVTNKGPDVLSKGLMKDAGDIEAWMQR